MASCKTRNSEWKKLTKVMMMAMYQRDQWTANRLRMSSFIQAMNSNPCQKRGAQVDPRPDRAGVRAGGGSAGCGGAATSEGAVDVAMRIIVGCVYHPANNCPNAASMVSN